MNQVRCCKCNRGLMQGVALFHKRNGSKNLYFCAQHLSVNSANQLLHELKQFYHILDLGRQINSGANVSHVLQ